jgi:hypothetical protein
MAYLVNWNTKVVTVPKTDLTQISVSPEIYELNLLLFWAAIHDIQDSDGMPFLDIMRSNAPVTLSGVTYVRTVEVINGYAIEFEDGAYQVNLFGANNNLLDSRVQNQVSLNASNSAGAVVVSAGSGLSPAQDAALTRLVNLAEADEELTGSIARLKQRGTSTVLLEKTVTGGVITPVSLTDA